MKIGYNPSIMTAYNSLSSTNNALEKTSRALSTGLRVASASDDAAGFAISLRLSSQISGLERAIRNTQDGVSMLQTAEEGLNQINSMLQRMRELSTQAANDTLTSQDRSYIQLEIEELKNNIDNIAQNTTFNRKRLLDGSSAGTWTSNEASTKVHINGAITNTDQFGQKKNTEGNYRIEIRAQPGQAEVQKSNIFNVAVTDGTGGTQEVNNVDDIDPKLPAPEIQININNVAEGDSGDGWEFTEGVLTISGDGVYSISGTSVPTANRVVVESGSEATIYLDNVNIDVGSTNSACAFDITGATVNMYLKGINSLKSGYGRAGLEVPDGSTLIISSASGNGRTDGSLTAQSTAKGTGIGGPCLPYAQTGRAGTITINGGSITAIGTEGCAGIGGGDTGGPDGGGIITINGGYINAKGSNGGAGIGTGYFASYPNVGDDGTQITITGGTIIAEGGNNAAGIGGGYNSDSGTIRIKNGLQNSILATAGGNAENIGRGSGGNITNVEYFDDTDSEEDVDPDDPTAAPEIKASVRLTTLSEINQFYNVDGKFLVSEPQTITITQGDGKQANVTLYSNDTMYDVADKINDAIENTLGQGLYVDNRAKFCTIADGTASSSESVWSKDPIYDSNGLLKGYTTNATMLVRSAIAGSNGRLTFSSQNEDLLNALGLSTIQEATDSKFTASVYDSHTGATVAKNIATDGNKISGVIHPNIDIEFDPTANTKASWDEATKRYVLSGNINEPYITTVHIVDRSASFQIGQSTGEDIFINIGDMTSSSLGISKVNVITRDNAVEAMHAIDIAIHKVSSQRSKIGAYQNELEYNANSLTQTSVQMSASESRIKDTDMATEMLEFVKLQILNNSGSAMLAQANQLSQSVVNLFSM